MNITKILFSIIIGIAVATSADAANTMCVTNDNTNIILDPSIEGTGSTFDEQSATWSVTFSYGTISGIASCNSLSGIVGTAYPQYNNQITQGYQQNQLHCWCRITSPVRSAWVFENPYPSPSDCAVYCVRYCGIRVRDYIDFRRVFFGSAGM